MPPRYCDYVLSTYLSAIGTQEKLLEISSQLEEARDLNQGSHTPFTTIAALAPLFDRGLLFRVLGAELRARGHRSTGSMEKALALMASTSNVTDEINLVNAAIGRLLKTIGPLSVSFAGAQQIRAAEKKAKDLGLDDIKSFTNLIQALKTQEGDDFVLIKLALLDALIQDQDIFENSFTQGVLNRVTSIFRKEELKGWSYQVDYLNEQTAGQETDKIVQQKMSALESKMNSQTARYDDNFMVFLNELIKNFVPWAPTLTRISWSFKLIDLATHLSSDQLFQKALNSIFRQVMDSAMSNGIPAKLEILATFYQKNNPTRFGAIRDLLRHVPLPPLKAAQGTS